MSFEDRLIDEIKIRINEEIERCFDGIMSAQDWPDYKRRVGLTTGLRQALKIIDDASKHVNQ